MSSNKGNHFRSNTINTFNYHKIFKLNEKKNQENKHNPTKLIKNMKELVLNENKYVSYFKKYNELTRNFSFKKPGNNKYPVTKNEEYIKIGETTSESSTSIYLTLQTLKSKKSNNSTHELKLLSGINKKYNHSQKKLKIKSIKFRSLSSIINEKKDSMKIMDNYEGIIDKNNKKKIIDILFNFCQEIPKLKNMFVIKEQKSIINGKIYNKKYFNTKLICESMSLKYKNVFTNEEHFLFIPFSFLPMYYMLSFDKFKLFLATIIRYNIDDGKFVIIQSDLQNLIYSFYKYIKKQIKNEEYLANIMYNINENIINFNYDWIVSPEEESKAIYKVEIILPNIKFIIHDIDTLFIKTLPKNLVINLLQNSFVNWEKYCTEELNVNFQFRQLYNEITNNKIENHINKIYNLNEHTLHSKKNEYSFFFTDDVFMSYYEILRLNTVMILSGENYEIFKKFYLNLEEIKLLYKANQIWSLTEIIYKCLFINKNNGKMILNLNLLKGLDINYFLRLKQTKFELPPDDNNLIKFKSNNLKIEILKPYYLNYMIDNYGDISKINYSLPIGLFKFLLNHEIDDYYQIFYRNKKDLNYPKIYNVSEIEKIFKNEEKRNNYYQIYNNESESPTLFKRYSKQPSIQKKKFGKFLHRSVTGEVGISQFLPLKKTSQKLTLTSKFS